MLKELEQQEKDLLAKLNAVRESITEEKTRLAEHKFGVRVGSIVKDRKGIEHKVTQVDTRYYDGSPWLVGNPKKKDGTFGIAQRNLYSCWTLLTT